MRRKIPLEKIFLTIFGDFKRFVGRKLGDFESKPRKLEMKRSICIDATS